MLEVSNGFTAEMNDFLSCSLNPIAVLPLFVNNLVSPRRELLLEESLGLARWSGGSYSFCGSSLIGLSVVPPCPVCLVWVWPVCYEFDFAKKT